MLINIPAPWYYGHPSRPRGIFIWTLKEALELRTGYLDDIELGLIPYAPCMEYLPTLALKITQM
jgi:hypothetical protein